MTPTEIVTAYEAGAAFVKLFPAGNMGLAYCKAVMAPINHIPLMAVGGIGLDNLRDYLCAGFESVGVGSSLTCQGNDSKQGIFQAVFLSLPNICKLLQQRKIIKRKGEDYEKLHHYH